MSLSIYVGNTSIVRLDDLADNAGEYQNDATVTLQSLVDKRTGDAVSGVAAPLAMNYVAASNGRYEALIPYSAVLSAGKAYLLKVLVVAASGLRAEWDATVIAQTRTEAA